MIEAVAELLERRPGPARRSWTKQTQTSRTGARDAWHCLGNARGRTIIEAQHGALVEALAETRQRSIDTSTCRAALTSMVINAVPAAEVRLS